MIHRVGAAWTGERQAWGCCFGKDGGPDFRISGTGANRESRHGSQTGQQPSWRRACTMGSKKEPQYLPGQFPVRQRGMRYRGWNRGQTARSQ